MKIELTEEQIRAGAEVLMGNYLDKPKEEWDYTDRVWATATTRTVMREVLGHEDSVDVDEARAKRISLAIAEAIFDADNYPSAAAVLGLDMRKLAEAVTEKVIDALWQ